MESHLSNDEFLLKLTSLFDTRRQKDHGSVFLTQKCLSYDPTATSSPTSLDAPASILIRATSGSNTKDSKSKTKLSTIVLPDQLETFFARYAEVCKGGMSALKKRDRSKAKEKLKAKRRKMGAAGGGEKVEEKKS